MLGLILVLGLWVIVVWRCARAVAWYGTVRRAGAMTAPMGMLALTATVLAYSARLDGWLHVDNLGALLRRWILGATWLVTQPLLVGFMRTHGRVERGSRGRRLSVAATWIMIAATGLLWLVSPVHHGEVVTLNAVSGHWMTAFLAVTYIWMIEIGIELMVGGARVLRAIRHDLPGAVCAGFVIATGVCSIVGPILLSVDRMLHTGVTSMTTLAAVGTLTMPLSAGLAALGGASVPALEWISSQRVARRTIRQLTPEWRWAVQTHPEAVMRLPRWSRLTDAALVAERMRIEILDARAAEEASQLV